REPDRTVARRSERTAARPHSRGACDLPRDEAGVRDVVLRQGIELSPRRPGRISITGHVVDRADLTGAERGYRRTHSWPGGAYLGVPALRTEPDHGILLLRAQEQGRRGRDERGGRRNAHHVLRCGAAGLLRPPKEIGGA